MDICGLCGCVMANPDNALCNHCGGDHWVQPNDYKKFELKLYILEACKNLNVSWEELKVKVCS